MWTAAGGAPLAGAVKAEAHAEVQGETGVASAPLHCLRRTATAAASLARPAYRTFTPKDAAGGTSLQAGRQPVSLAWPHGLNRCLPPPPPSRPSAPSATE